MTTSMEPEGLAVGMITYECSRRIHSWSSAALINAWHRPFFQCASKRTRGDPPGQSRKRAGGDGSKKEGAHRSGAAARQFYRQYGLPNHVEVSEPC